MVARIMGIAFLFVFFVTVCCHKKRAVIPDSQNMAVLEKAAATADIALSGTAEWIDDLGAYGVNEQACPLPTMTVLEQSFWLFSIDDVQAE